MATPLYSFVGGTIAPDGSVSFMVTRDSGTDFDLTTLVLRHQDDDGTSLVYDGGAGGAQAGWTVTINELGGGSGAGALQIVIRRDAGWSASSTLNRFVELSVALTGSGDALNDTTTIASLTAFGVEGSGGAPTYSFHTDEEGTEIAPDDAIAVSFSRSSGTGFAHLTDARIDHSVHGIIYSNGTVTAGFSVTWGNEGGAGDGGGTIVAIIRRTDGWLTGDQNLTRLRMALIDSADVLDDSSGDVATTTAYSVVTVTGVCGGINAIRYTLSQLRERIRREVNDPAMFPNGRNKPAASLKFTNAMIDSTVNDVLIQLSTSVSIQAFENLGYTDVSYSSPSIDIPTVIDCECIIKVEDISNGTSKPRRIRFARENDQTPDNTGGRVFSLFQDGTNHKLRLRPEATAGISLRIWYIQSPAIFTTEDGSSSLEQHPFSPRWRELIILGTARKLLRTFGGIEDQQEIQYQELMVLWGQMKSRHRGPRRIPRRRRGI